MRRNANKIVMAILLILLCLVLITTSVVSGIFAKYIVQKQVTMMFGFESFGIKVEVIIPQYIQDIAGVKYDEGEDLDTKEGYVTLSNLWLCPGDSYLDAVTVRVTGKPTTDAKITIMPTLQFGNIDDFVIDKGDFPTMMQEDSSVVCIPMRFFVNGGDPVAGKYNTLSTNSDVSWSIENKIKSALINRCGYSSNGSNGVYKTLERGKEYKLEDDTAEIQTFGFDWQKFANESSNGAPFDEVGTWISDKEPTFTITFRINVEQVTTSEQT